MSINILHITDKKRSVENSIVDISDFSWTEGEEADVDFILRDNVSLYCLDHDHQRAVFVETPPDVNMSEAPFFYDAQYKYAQRLIAVPYADFHQAAEQIKAGLDHLILLYSTGRCGSTLLSKAFAQINSVTSLSEPDVFSQLVMMRPLDGSNDDQIRQLAKSSLAFLTQPVSPLSSQFHILKLRSFGIEIGELIYQILPSIKTLFLYRNAEDVIKSAVRAYSSLRIHYSSHELCNNIEFLCRFTPLLKEYIQYIEGEPSVIDSEAISWLSVMHRYLVLYHKGHQIRGVRYEDLVREPHEITQALLEYCAVPTDQSSIVSCVDNVFSKDAQQGSLLSRDAYADKEDAVHQVFEIQRKTSCLFREHPEITSADCFLPGTITPSLQ